MKIESGKYSTEKVQNYHIIPLIFKVFSTGRFWLVILSFSFFNICFQKYMLDYLNSWWNFNNKNKFLRITFFSFKKLTLEFGIFFKKSEKKK